MRLHLLGGHFLAVVHVLKPETRPVKLFVIFLHQRLTFGARFSSDAGTVCGFCIRDLSSRKWIMSAFVLTSDSAALLSTEQH